MSDSSWFAPMSSAIISAAPVDLRPALTVAHAAFASRLSSAPAGVVDAARNAVTGAVMEVSMSAVTAALDGVTGPIAEILAEVQSAVGQATAALYGAIEDALGPLTGAANALRRAADAAWMVARAPANIARSLLKAENIAGRVAMLTGLPPVTAAWAVAVDARQTLVLASDVASRVAAMAEAAWGAVVRVLDMIRSRLYDMVGAMSDIVNDALSAMTNGVNDLVGDAVSALSGGIASAIDSVLPAV